MSTLVLFLSLWVFLINNVASTSEFFHLPIRRQNVTREIRTSNSSNSTKYSKRMLNIDLPLQANAYTITLGIGSTNQEVTLILDTGSSDMIVISDENPSCSNDLSYYCDTFGTFDSDSSNTLQKLNEQYSLKYADGTTSNGDWVQDSINVDDKTVVMIFGLASDTNSIGVFGIGLQGLETREKKYNNYPMQLKTQGLTKKNTYSIYLDYASGDGDILFGAIDSNMIDKNNFYTFPMVNRYADQGVTNPIRTEITMQGIGMQTKDGDQITFSTTKLPALLDSGSTLSFLPTAIFDSLNENLANSGISLTDPVNGAYGIDCSYRSDSETLVVVDFGGFQIDIPLSNLVINNTVSGKCEFGFTPQDTATVVLGDTFFSSAYVVFDLDDYEISLSPLKKDIESGQFETIETTVPYAKKADSYSNTWSADEGVQTGGNIFTMTSKASVSSIKTTTLTPSSGTVTTSTSSSKKQTIASTITTLSFIASTSSQYETSTISKPLDTPTQVESSTIITQQTRSVTTLDTTLSTRRVTSELIFQTSFGTTTCFALPWEHDDQSDPFNGFDIFDLFPFLRWFF